MVETSLESNFVSMKHAVQFVDIQDQYYCKADLSCYFKFNDYTPQEGDRVAIFKLGWNFVKDYIVFEWAPVGCQPENDIHTVVFNRHVLPKKNLEEIYQICYLSGENELHGASSPFQFLNEKQKPDQASSTLSVDESVYESLSKQKAATSSQNDQEKEIKKLKEENELLKEALKVALIHKDTSQVPSKNYDTEIAELQQITGTLKNAIESQQLEFNVLKTKITESKEEYKKLYLEKYKVEKKYESLKSKKEKEVKPSNLIDFDISELGSIPPFPFSNNLDK